MRRNGLMAGLLFGVLMTSGCGPAELKPFTPPGGGWTASFPGEPKSQTQNQMGITLTMYAVEERNGAYLVSVNQLPENIPDDQVQARLKDARDGAINASGAKLISDKPLKLDGKYPGIELRASITKPIDGIIRQRIYLVGKTMYQIMVLGKESLTDSDHSTKFLDSLTLTK